MTRQLSFRNLALCVALLTGMSTAAFAQSNTGTIRGAALDPSGALIPHAQITVSNAAGFSRSTKSDSGGNFEMSHLPSGIYSVSVTAAGFTPALEGDIHIVSDKVTRQTIKLGISVDQFVEVLANAESSVRARGTTADSL